MPGTVLALALVCMGGGTAIKQVETTVSGSNSGTYNYGGGNYSGSYSGTVSGTRAQGYADQVDIELQDGSGRIRLPRVVLPVLHGGDGGWFELQKLRVTDREIEASAAVNFINKPKVHIDRLTAIISITGKAGTFTGRCQAVEAQAERKF
jgi:hypothetical protein